MSGRTGREIWHYERPKSASATISGDAAIGVNRGVAVLGDRVFYLTDNAHLIALNRLTGALMWDVETPEGAAGQFGGTSAPLVVGDLVLTGVSGGDNGIRGFVAAYKATTGELAWKLMTIPKPGDTGPIAGTWKGSALALGGGATWLSGSADVDAGVVYWAVGNPHPDTDGDERAGTNLYTNSDLAIDAKTGKLLWHFQFTPHDLHDWDANEPIVLVNAKWRGQDRKLLLHANRNGFLYVLDRTSGKPLMATRMVDKLTWASGIDETTWTPKLLPANETNEQGVLDLPGGAGRYELVFHGIQSLHPAVLRDDGGGLWQLSARPKTGDMADTPIQRTRAKKILRAFNIETGKAEWQIDMPGPVQSNYCGSANYCGRLGVFRREQWRFCRGRCTHRQVSLAFRDESFHQSFADDVRSERQAVCGDRFRSQHPFVCSTRGAGAEIAARELVRGENKVKANLSRRSFLGASAGFAAAGFSTLANPIAAAAQSVGVKAGDLPGSDDQGSQGLRYGYQQNS